MILCDDGQNGRDLKELWGHFIGAVFVPHYGNFYSCFIDCSTCATLECLNRRWSAWSSALSCSSDFIRRVRSPDFGELARKTFGANLNSFISDASLVNRTKQWPCSFCVYGTHLCLIIKLKNKGAHINIAPFGLQIRLNSPGI